jgi:cyclic beta-1,2-glucan synthetase
MSYKGRSMLLSWTGTIFEYLMPSLWMKTSPHSILEQSMRNVVETQRFYFRSRCPIWGISESAHAEVDENGSYQYQAFGLPVLALKPTEAPPSVITPYASFLALETNFGAAVRNLRHMWQYGCSGLYGFYEAVEFKDTRSGRSEAVLVKSWMAHHLAMSLMAVTNRLLGSPFQRYFHDNPQVMATELLLHEKVPAGLTVESGLVREPALRALKKIIRGTFPHKKSYNLAIAPTKNTES